MNKRIIVTYLFLLTVNLIGLGQSGVDSLETDNYSRDSINGIYIPKDLNDCFTQIDVFLSDSIKNQVKSWNEKEFLVNAHFGLGMWMRNNWGLWGGSRLQVFFNDKGIEHPDDMSGIILGSYHRYLAGKKIHFKKQIEQYRAYWEALPSSSRFEAKTKENKIYSALDTALIHSDSIVDIQLIGYDKLPKKLKRFNNLSKLTIENCPNLDFFKTFKSIARYQNLTELYLFENRVKDYPSNLGKITGLKILWISGDSLSQLPVELKYLKNMNALIITECPKIHLDTLFQLLIDIENLRELDLSENGLTDIPESINNLTQLTDLWFDGNLLSEIPKGVKPLPNLEHLALFNNNIKSIELEPGDLPNLENINLCYNSFGSFPVELSYLKNLEQITIWDSDISVIPEEISKLRGLKYLNLQLNNLTDEQKEKLRFLLPETELKL